MKKETGHPKSFCIGSGLHFSNKALSSLVSSIGLNLTDFLMVEGNSEQTILKA